MRIDLHIHIEPSAEAVQFEQTVLGILNTLKTEFTQMSAELDRLTASVTAIKDVADSAVALIAGLAQQIRDLANSPAALTALADQLDADKQELADAITANTPTP